MKFSKKILPVICSLSLLLTACGNTNGDAGEENGTGNAGSNVETTVDDSAENSDGDSEATVSPAESDIALDVAWQDQIANMGMGWNLGNTMDAIGASGLEAETWWVAQKVYTSQATIDAVRDAGFKTVRVPVSWHDHVTITVGEDGNDIYTIDSAWMARIKEIVDYCYNDEMYVILNSHHDCDKNFVYPSAECKDRSINYLTQIWTQISEEFKDYDSHLIFEIMNEMRLAGTSNEWWCQGTVLTDAYDCINAYNQAGLDAIRANGSEYNKARFVSCPGYAASPSCMTGYSLPEDKGGYSDRIIVAMHAYSPYEFAMLAQGTYDTNVENAIDYVFTEANKFTAAGVPVIIDEFGIVTADNNYDDRLSWITYYITDAMTKCKDQNGNVVKIPCVIWDNNAIGAKGNEAFEYLDRENFTWLDPTFIDTFISTWESNK